MRPTTPLLDPVPGVTPASAVPVVPPAPPHSTPDGSDGTDPLVRALEAVAARPCLALALSGGRCLAVTTFAVEPVSLDAGALTVVLALAGGRRAHAFALAMGSLTLNHLRPGEAALARRFGGAGIGAGWDEVLGLAVAYRGDRPPVLRRAGVWVEVVPQAPGDHLEWLDAHVVDAMTVLPRRSRPEVA